jgi:hypothetical protein
VESAPAHRSERTETEEKDDGLGPFVGEKGVHSAIPVQ